MIRVRLRGTRSASVPQSGCCLGISSFLGLVTLVDVLFPLWHRKRQALHDIAAKTQVVRPR